MLASGTVLQNRYQILRPLGAGGMGAVYLANDARLNRPVVVKENVGGDPQQFQTEAHILAALSHPNLPSVSDHFVEPSGAQYLVMDYIEGQDLDLVLQQRGPLPESAVLEWMRQIFHAVEYLHANRIIHRDIKPHNIIVTPQGKAVLVDFGIAKLYLPGQATQTGARAATPGFAAPEQYAGGTTERSDIYALGATLYCLLTGRVPPESPDRSAGAVLTPPRQINRTVVLNTETAILMAMNLSAAQRYRSVAEMEKALYEPPSTAIPVPHDQVVVKTVRRVPSRLAVIGVLVTLIMLACVLLIWLPGSLSTQNATSIAFSPDGTVLAVGYKDNFVKLWDVASGRESRTLEHSSGIRCVAFSPNGTILASGSWSVAVGTVKLWDVTTGREIRTLTGHYGAVYSIIFSPDGKMMASGGEDKIVRIWDVANWRELRMFSTSETGYVLSMAFSPDGTLLATGSGDSKVKLWEVSSGRELKVLAGHSSWVHSVGFSPDGRTLASASNDNTARLWDVASGRELNILRNNMSVMSVAFSPDGTILASGAGDKMVTLWDAANGRPLRTLGVHTGWVENVAFAPDGRMLASQSEDRTVRLWDVASGRELRTFSRKMWGIW